MLRQHHENTTPSDIPSFVTSPFFKFSPGDFQHVIFKLDDFRTAKTFSHWSRLTKVLHNSFQSL